jgi:hypothetical protein
MRKKPKDAGVQRPDLLQVRLASYLKPESAADELAKTKILDLPEL